MNKTLVILNPAARSEKASRLLERIRELSGGAPVRLTSEAGDASRIAAEGAAPTSSQVTVAEGASLA
ncbi:MAG: hypothetical protein EBY32_08015, partial [Proteobacteria bacterium]|nr:hypothetical protein [Pseudomonadota bacterium]